MITIIITGVIALVVGFVLGYLLINMTLKYRSKNIIKDCLLYTSDAADE